jgi:pyruvate dehydrogenase E1 component alpha subunit
MFGSRSGSQQRADAAVEESADAAVEESADADRTGPGPETADGPVPATDVAPPEVRLALYESMVRLRGFEKRAYDLFLQGLVKGTSHLGLGQEAIAAAFGQAMRADDYTFATYRGHNHTLARKVPMTPVMGELMGRSCGLMAGKGGSMHLTSVEHGMMGCYAIVGAHLTIANGAAFSAKRRGTDQVTVCFFGDGTTNIGAFHEALNLAAVWKLPIVFVCENNLWMEYTPIASVTAVARPAADRAAAYGLDRNDVAAMYGAATESLARARRGEGPSLIEALTYRHGGHSRADPGKYRSDEELAYWLARDPLPSYRDRLLDAGALPETLEAIESAAAAEVDLATEQAKASPPPGLELVMTDVWADGGSSWRN